MRYDYKEILKIFENILQFAHEIDINYTIIHNHLTCDPPPLPHNQA